MNTELRIISRQEAKAKGLKRYFTGMPCARWHVTERYVGDRKCIECAGYNEKVRVRRATPEARQKRSIYRRTEAQRKAQREQIKKWRAEHPDEWKAIADRARHKPGATDKKNAQRRTPRARKVNREQMKRWRRDNPERWRAIEARSKAIREGRIDGSQDHYTADDIQRILVLQKGKCAFCRKSINKHGFEVDHIMPLWLGGSDGACNIQLVCSAKAGACNQRKGHKHPIEFAQSLGMLL